MHRNVNGLRALLRAGDALSKYSAMEMPDVLCLSETKISDDLVGSFSSLLPEYDHRYWSCATTKGYSGTAIFSRVKPISVIRGLGSAKHDSEGRLIALEFDKLFVVHTYVPNAGMKLERLEYRTKEWDVDMLAMLVRLRERKPVVWCGDLNVAFEDIDIHDPKANRNKSPGFTDAERANFGRVLSAGFTDTFRSRNQGVQRFSYWSHRMDLRARNKGWRLDYMMLSHPDALREAEIRPMVMGSDHCPVVCSLDLAKL